MGKVLKIMNGDTMRTTFESMLATICSFVMVHLPEIQAFITFSLTVFFLMYKIREAKARAEIAENEKRNKNHSCGK